jgi:hypothetical protein
VATIPKLAIISLIIVILTLMLPGCNRMNQTGRDFKGNYPYIEYNNVIQLYLPRYFNDETGCVTASSINDENFQLVNDFRLTTQPKVGFVLLVKSNRLVGTFGVENMDLFWFDEEQGKWVEIEFSVENPDLLKDGDIFQQRKYLELGNKKCNFFPDEPVYIVPNGQVSWAEGKYRLFIIGYELSDLGEFPSTIIGDYVDFTLIGD